MKNRVTSAGKGQGDGVRRKCIDGVRLEYTQPRGLHFVVENPDESLAHWHREKLRESVLREIQEFIEEVAVAVRNLKPGRKITLSSKPIQVTIESQADETADTEARAAAAKGKKKKVTT